MSVARFMFAVVLFGFTLLGPAGAQTVDTPSVVTNLYLESVKKVATYWVETRPWPKHYLEYLTMVKEEFAPILSTAALAELEARPPSGPKELNTQPVDDDAVYNGMIATVAKAEFFVLSESIEGDQAKVEVETTVANAFGSGKTESFQDVLTLVRENGHWVLTPQAFKTFAF